MMNLTTWRFTTTRDIKWLNIMYGAYMAKKDGGAESLDSESTVPLVDVVLEQASTVVASKKSIDPIETTLVESMERANDEANSRDLLRDEGNDSDSTDSSKENKVRTSN